VSNLFGDLVIFALVDDGEQCPATDVECLNERVQGWNAERPGVTADSRQQTSFHQMPSTRKTLFPTTILDKLKAVYSSYLSQSYTCQMDHAMDQCTCHLTQVNILHLDFSQTGRYSIYTPLKDERLSWLWWFTMR